MGEEGLDLPMGSLFPKGPSAGWKVRPQERVGPLPGCLAIAVGARRSPTLGLSSSWGLMRPLHPWPPDKTQG